MFRGLCCAKATTNALTPGVSTTSSLRRAAARFSSFLHFKTGFSNNFAPAP